MTARAPVTGRLLRNLGVDDFVALVLVLVHGAEDNLLVVGLLQDGGRLRRSRRAIAGPDAEDVPFLLCC